NGTDLYVSGGFQFANNVEVRNIARWNGCDYFPLFDPRPSDTNNPNSAPIGFVSFSSSIKPIATLGQEVFACGGFLNRLDHNGHDDFTVRWTGSNWVSWPLRIFSSSVAAFAMAASSNAVYLGGQFMFQTSSIPGAPVSFNIVKWDRTNFVALGDGIRYINDVVVNNNIQQAFVNAIAITPNGDVWAGRGFVVHTPSGCA